MEKGGHFENYLTPCQSLPGIFEMPQDALLPLNMVPYKPEVEEKSKQATILYCSLVVILITQAYGTWWGL